MALALPRLAILKPQPTYRRLWQLGGVLAVWATMLSVANLVLPADKAIQPLQLGHDFLPFYMAGTFARTGETHSPYDLEYSRRWQEQIASAAGMGEVSGPWWNPPHAAWLFAPFTLLPIRLALAAWTMFGVGCLLTSVVLLARMIPPPHDGSPPWTRWGLIPLLMLVSTPLAQAISHGQNTFFSLLLTTLTVVAWRARKPLVAGVVCGLLFYKPQLGIVLAVAMTLALGWRVFAGVALVGVATLLTIHLTLPGALSDYLRLLPQNLSSMQIGREYIWERHVTLRAFWRLFVQGYAVGPATWVTLSLTLASMAALGGLIVKSIVRQRTLQHVDTPWHDDTAAMRRDRLIAATLAASPLLMPFYFDYDLLVLAIPATLLARDRMLAPSRLGRLTTLAFGLLFAATMFNSGLTRLGGVNLSALALAWVASLLAVRAVPRRPSVIRVPTPRPAPLPAVRAA